FAGRCARARSTGRSRAALALLDVLLALFAERRAVHGGEAEGLHLVVRADVDREAPHHDLAPMHRGVADARSLLVADEHARLAERDGVGSPVAEGLVAGARRGQEADEHGELPDRQDGAAPVDGAGVDVGDARCGGHDPASFPSTYWARPVLRMSSIS